MPAHLLIAWTACTVFCVITTGMSIMSTLRVPSPAVSGQRIRPARSPGAAVVILPSLVAALCLIVTVVCGFYGDLHNGEPPVGLILSAIILLSSWAQKYIPSAGVFGFRQEKRGRSS